RIDKESFSMAPTFTSLKTLGWHVIELADGHDLQRCADTLIEAITAARNNPKVPVAIHARTIKGYGTAKTEQSSSGGHGFPLSDPKDLMGFISEIYKGERIPAEFVSWADELVSEKAKKDAAKAAAPKSTAAKPGKIQ